MIKDAIKRVIILFIICSVAAGSLSYVYSITKPKIEQYVIDELNNSLKKVMPEGTKFEEVTKSAKWNVYKGESIIGTINKVNPLGYGGPVQIIYGLDNEKKIVKVLIIDQTETPGLGTKIAESKFLDQFIGKTENEVVLIKDDQINGKIDAVTAATISSRALTNAVKKSMNQ